jgi:hypothetical protein
MVASVDGDDTRAHVTVVNRRGESTSFDPSDVLATKDF